jgi:hypothetical protein
MAVQFGGMAAEERHFHAANATGVARQRRGILALIVVLKMVPETV